MQQILIVITPEVSILESGPGPVVQISDNIKGSQQTAAMATSLFLNTEELACAMDH